MFFFFFEELYYQSEINKAFKNICLNKMLIDGYFDMSKYIWGRIKKDEMYSRLIAEKSKFSILYKSSTSYPLNENAVEMWKQYFGGNEYADDIDSEITYTESEAIVNWVYRSFKSAVEREDFTKEILHNIKDLYGIHNHISFSRGVVYNNKKVEINFISSISALNNEISRCQAKGLQLFFRGHANANYTLVPSVMRSSYWQKNERRMYNDIVISCPMDFEKYHTHLEKLVEMQHYGLPTRLLDITRNPLVALYFACESQFDSFGEIVLLSSNSDQIKYPQSDVITILASLPLFDSDIQRQFKKWAQDATLSEEDFNKNIARLLHEVRLEKPAFQAEVRKDDLLKGFIVYALKNNSRIVKQDGAFILCGLIDEQSSLNHFRFQEKGKKVVLLIDKKQRLLKQLDNFSINHSTLFPEIECVSEYIKNKYNKPI